MTSINKALELIKQFEGCKLTAYPDNGGRITIGWGSTGPDITLPLAWNQQQADDRLQEDVKKASDVVTSLVKVPLNDNQKAALIDFVYNLGGWNFRKSGLLKALNAYEYSTAADQLLLWVKQGAYTLPGLVKRRQAERALFMLPA